MIELVHCEAGDDASKSDNPQVVIHESGDDRLVPTVGETVGHVGERMGDHFR